MKEVLVAKLRILTKWIITKKIDFIEHEFCKYSLFTIIKIGDFTIHIELFNDSDIITALNCYNDKEHIMSIDGSTEYCLKELDEILLSK